LSTQIKDIELMQRVVERDSKALESLYDKYSPVLFTLINKILGSKEKAEIVLTEIFVIIWQKCELFNLETQNLFTWLILLTRNKSLDYLKRERGDQLPEYNDEYENSEIIPKISPEITPLDIEDAFDKRDLIFNAMGNLTDAQQYVLSLAFYEGLNENEIAKRLNIPIPTIKSKLRVILNSFRDVLDKETIQ
jgi:RNA polymerase sigma-70 factor (ECF subfamily)